MRRLRVALPVCVPLLLVACVSPDARTAVQEMNAIEQMSVAFEGSPSQREIEPLLVKALDATGMADTEENRSRVGSALVSLRKEYNISELDLLRCVPTISGGPGLPTLEFPTAAAMCATIAR